MQAGGRRFDPVNLHQDGKPKSSRAWRIACRRRDLGLIVSIDRLFLFFNNLEEVVKIYQLALVRCDDALVATGGL